MHTNSHQKVATTDRVGGCCILVSLLRNESAARIGIT
jgi:hypothetical protein